MLARAIREGVGHDGRGLGGQMWWWAFRALSDEDLASIIVYLRSLPPVANSLPPRLLSPELEKGRAEGARPLDGPVAARDLTDPVERGRYLIEIADCLGCHSAWEAPIQPGLGGGGNAVERFGEDHLEPPGSRILHQHLDARSHQARAGERMIRVAVMDVPALAPGALFTHPDLVFDGGVALIVRGVARVDGYRGHVASLRPAGGCSG